MTLSEDIQSNSEYHQFLLGKLSELEHTPSAFASQTKYLNDLGNELKNVERKVGKLAKITKQERKEHEDIRDSVGRKFIAKVTGKKEKFEQKQAKEEREYVEALEKEIKEKNQAETLRKLIAEAQKVKAELEPKIAEYHDRDKELHALYSRIFDGPTEDYPQDDFLESNLTKAKEEYDKVQEKFMAEQQAGELLNQARDCMEHCRANISTALGYSTYDMWGGGTFADAMERSSLSKAHQMASSSQMLLMRAAHMSPNVDSRILDGLYIAQGSIISDVVFDNIFTDLAFHQRIKDSLASSSQAIHLLTIQQTQAAERVSSLFRASEAAKKNLASRREELDRFRRSVFEGVADQTGGNMTLSAEDEVDLGRSPTYKPPEGPPPGYGGAR